MGSVKAQRILSRFLNAKESEPLVKDEGDFVLEYLPRHQAAVATVAAKVHAAIKHYRSAGIPIRHKLLIQLDGKGASRAGGLYWPNSSPPTLKIAPKQYDAPDLMATISHELGHYVHDRVVPGGEHNREIVDRFNWAMRQKQNVTQTVRDDAGTKVKIKVVEAEIKALQEARYETKPLPPKGKVFDYPWINYSGKRIILRAKLVRKSGKNVELELIEPPREYTASLPRNQKRSPDGNPIIFESAITLTYVGTKPEVESKIKDLEQERHALYATFADRDESRDEEYAKRYEKQRHVWAPTPYSRKNPSEWFAELCTTFALGHLDSGVVEWLLSVISTGEAPAV